MMVMTGGKLMLSVSRIKILDLYDIASIFLIGFLLQFDKTNFWPLQDVA